MGLEGKWGEKIIFMSSGKSWISIIGKKTPLYLVFLDIEKAYDRVNRETLVCILWKIGFSKQICNTGWSIMMGPKWIFNNFWRN